MALVAGLRLLDRHGQALGLLHAIVVDVDDLPHVGVRVRIVAVGAGHAVALVGRRVPGHRGGALVAAQAQVLAGRLFDLAVRVVAGRAVEAVGPADLVRPGDAEQVAHVAVALQAQVRGHRAQVVRGAAERRQRFLLGLLGRVIGNEPGLRTRREVGCDGGSGRPDRHVVVAAVAIDAGHAAMGVLRGPPLGPGRTLVLLVALQAGLGPGHRIDTLLETENQPRLLAAGFHVLAGRPVAGFAVLPAVYVVVERLDVGLVALHADIVVVDHLRAGELRQRAPDLLVGDLAVGVIRPRPARINVRFCPARRRGLAAAGGVVRGRARGKSQAHHP